MKTEHAISGHVAALTKRWGYTYTFTKAGESKHSTSTDIDETITVDGVLTAKGSTVQPVRHKEGSPGKVTEFRFYSADHRAAQITTAHSIHVDDSTNYAVETVRQPAHSIGVWVISLTV